MNDEWKIIQVECLRGAEDFKAIRAAINGLSRELAPFCAFSVPGKNKPISINNQEAFLYQFQQGLKQAEKAFLADLRRRGGSIPKTFEEHLRSLPSEEERTKCKNYVKLDTWRTLKGPLLEILVLLSTLIKLHPLKKIELENILTPNIPIPVNDNNNVRFIWCRPLIMNSTSGMQARPDIVIATSDKKLDDTSIVSVVECKCRSQLDAQDIRREFGKAFDMKVRSYIILSYHETPQRLKDAAGKLGMELKDFGLSTSMRQTYLAGMRDMGHDLADVLESARHVERFVRTLEQSAIIADSKKL